MILLGVYPSKMYYAIFAWQVRLEFSPSLFCSSSMKKLSFSRIPLHLPQEVHIYSASLIATRTSPSSSLTHRLPFNSPFSRRQ